MNRPSVSDDPASHLTVHSLHDWASQELICTHFRWFPWAQNGYGRWGDGGQMCVCVCLVVLWIWIEVREGGGAEQWNELWPWCVVSSAETLEQPDGGLLSFFTWGISHRCIISTPHMCLCGVWGRYIAYRALWHSIDDLLQSHTSPFSLSQERLTISHPCATDASSNHASPHPTLSICSDSMAPVVLRVIAHRGWGMLVSWRRYYIGAYRVP